MKIIPWMDPNWGDLGNQHAVDTVAKSAFTNCQSVQALMGSAPSPFEPPRLHVAGGFPEKSSAKSLEEESHTYSSPTGLRIFFYFVSKESVSAH